MRNRFDEQLIQLNNELIRMGALCEEAIAYAVKYLIEHDKEMKENAIDTEKQIDRKERDIESHCMKLLIHQQPVASDFRIITSALKMISDMERIGDQAEDIAEIAEYVRLSDLNTRVHITNMAESVVHMVNNSIDSYVKKDINIAYSVIAMDDTVDRIFLQVKNEVIEAVRHGNDDAESLADLLMIAKYFERIGDHAENIAEWVIYSITGQHGFNIPC
ncbi:MAG: phosphate signaling complex protein PhoU [Ruminococcus sp.]|nr:phosphate signaling complex protein PhoU [Ruminococcus sp.]